MENEKKVNDKKISVIIPIYNTEKYLKKCLDSVKNQTYKNFEVIMVDDGSTDNSADICKEYEKNDSRFKYFYKENGGEGSARNYGIKKAGNDYIAFIDSDDYVALDYFETFEKYLSDNYDIVQCGMFICRGDKQNEYIACEGEYHNDEFIEMILKRNFPIFLFQTTTTKLYKRDLLINSKIMFDTKVTKSVDSLFNTMLLPHIHNVKILDVPKYYYKQDNSFVSKMKASYNKVFQTIRVGNITSEIRRNLIDELNLYDNMEIKIGFQTAICIIYISNAQEIENGGFSKEEKKKLYDLYFSVMDYPIDLAVKKFEGTDKIIALSSVHKNSVTISAIYKLRRIKRKLLSVKSCRKR